MRTLRYEGDFLTEGTGTGVGLVESCNRGSTTGSGLRWISGTITSEVESIIVGMGRIERVEDVEVRL